MPLFNSLTAMLPGAQPMQKAATDNYYDWLSKIDRAG